MLRDARRRIELLLGRRTAFPPPSLPADPRALRTGLAAWHHGAEPRYARLFLHGHPLLVQRAERALFTDLAQAGLVEKLAPSVYQPCVRLFPLYGRFVATDLLTHREADQVFSLMFEQVYLIRNMDVRPGDDVLEVCLGSGVNSLFAADTARRVTGVDISPRALAFARFNEGLGPAAVPLEIYEGSLLEPLEEARRFDTILINPPFELVPEGEAWFLHSDGGEDGLDVVRALLPQVPSRLAPKGRFQVISWSPAADGRAVLVDLLRDALPGHRLTVHLLDRAALDDHLEPFRESPPYASFRARLAARGLDEVLFLYVHTQPSAAPGIEVSTPAPEIAACHALADPWI